MHGPLDTVVSVGGCGRTYPRVKRGITGMNKLTEANCAGKSGADQQPEDSRNRFIIEIGCKCPPLHSCVRIFSVTSSPAPPQLPVPKAKRNSVEKVD